MRKQALVVALMLLLAGCQAPSATPTETPTADDRNSEPHEISVNNTIDETVTVDVYKHEGSFPSRNTMEVESGSIERMDVTEPAKYVVEIYIGGELEGGFTIQEDEFTCNYKRHMVEVTDEGVSVRMYQTLMACHTETVSK